MVDSNVSPEQAHQGNVPPDDEILYGAKARTSALLVEKRVIVSGDELTDAQPGFDQRTSEPIVSFRFNTAGARAIRARDAGECRQAVRHRARQRGDLGAGDPRADPRRLRADFRQLHRQSANDLAILLRAGALPAPLTMIEERTVGPGLGQDRSPRARSSSYVGAAMVVVFMLATYGLFGVFANIAVAINVAMIFGVLSLLNATLTLPGIAGIVLTVGIAVDSNVLIYERIREEVRGGRSPINAIDAGFSARSPRFWIPTSPPSSPPRCCSISAPARCAALP